MITKDDLKFRQLLSWGVKQITDPIEKLSVKLSLLKDQVFTVFVENNNEDILLEVARNTRGLKGKIDELIKKPNDFSELKSSLEKFHPNTSVQPVNFEMRMNDVQVTNTVKVSVENQPVFPEFPKEIKITNLSDIPSATIPLQEKTDLKKTESLLEELKKSLDSVARVIPSLKQEKIVLPSFPKPEKFPTQISFKESSDMLEALQGVRDDLSQVYEAIQEKEFNGGSTGQTVISSSGGRVTDININALRGITKTTAITVATSVVQLPSIPLQYRRSLIVYNNSANTIYIGGSNVTTANGMPVPTQSYSPPIDAGSHMGVYAIASTSGNDIRVLEVSSEREGA